MENQNRQFSLEKFVYRLLILIFVFAVSYVVYNFYTTLDDNQDFIVTSKKPDNTTSDKDKAILEAIKTVSDVKNNNNALSPTNLNISKMYGEVADKDTTSYYSAYVSIPVVDDEVMPYESTYENNVAYQIYGKLQVRYALFNEMLDNLYGVTPASIVEKYNYDKSAIIGKYNPEDIHHSPGFSNTYKIPTFQNVNIYNYDGDGYYIEDENNIKDIMSMASVYTYYHDPYDYNKFLEYAYYLFDNSYTYVASISEVYYCSGCMHYDLTNEDIAHLYEKPDVNFDKVSDILHTQKQLAKDQPYKSGKLVHMEEDSYTVNHGTYDKYISDLHNDNRDTYNNYCPGHVDLDVYVKVMTLDAGYSLASIDEDYGNNRKEYNLSWTGWDAIKLSEARELMYKDWEKEYGISESLVNLVKPLTQEEINYYLNRISTDVSSSRRKIIETALRSVGRIPYYYGGKTNSLGYENSNFGRKVIPDYKGRCLKGLDCSGWINWVYNTTYKRIFVSAEGTTKLAGTGTKIRRENLKPGDIIVRPGHDSHVMMFLEWADDGRVTVIHENGTANNVSIGTYDAYYPYYRSILDM